MSSWILSVWNGVELHTPVRLLYCGKSSTAWSEASCLILLVAHGKMSNHSCQSSRNKKKTTRRLPNAAATLSEAAQPWLRLFRQDFFFNFNSSRVPSSHELYPCVALQVVQQSSFFRPCGTLVASLEDELLYLPLACQPARTFSNRSYVLRGSKQVGLWLWTFMLVEGRSTTNRKGLISYALSCITILARSGHELFTLLQLQSQGLLETWQLDHKR